MEILFYIVIGLIVALIIFALGWHSGQRVGNKIELPEGPRVIVNMPADAKILPQMDGDKVIASERAVLWYSVYCKAIENGLGACAADDADQAVAKVFGDS